MPYGDHFPVMDSGDFGNFCPTTHENPAEVVISLAASLPVLLARTIDRNRLITVMINSGPASIISIPTSRASGNPPCTK